MLSCSILDKTKFCSCFFFSCCCFLHVLVYIKPLKVPFFSVPQSLMQTDTEVPLHMQKVIYLKPELHKLRSIQDKIFLPGNGKSHYLCTCRRASILFERSKTCSLLCWPVEGTWTFQTNFFRTHVAREADCSLPKYSDRPVKFGGSLPVLTPLHISHFHTLKKSSFKCLLLI